MIKTAKTASVLNDIENIASGHPDRVIKKAIKREMHKNINSIMHDILK